MTPENQPSRLAPALSTRDAFRLANVFKALADPTRLRIISELASGQRCVHEIAESLELNQPAVSHQLRLLRDRGLVRYRREGRHIIYALDDGHVHELFSMAREHLEHE